jgi:YVTN family beta-propeller protein
VAAAVDAQRDLAAHPWPEEAQIKARMGLHTGEPKVGAERYVGIGVHRAARIGAAGHGGQVLLSSTTRELAEEDLPPGITIRDLGERRLKDIEQPQHLYQLVIEGLENDFAQLRTLDVELRRKRRRMYAGSALIGVIAAAVAIPIFALGQGGGKTGATASPNSVAVIDPGTNRVVTAIPVGARPESIAVGGGSAWVANVDEKTLSQIDLRERSLKRNFPLPATPTALAYGFNAVWVVHGLLGTLSRVDPQYGVNKTIPERTFVRGVGGGVTTGVGSVWVTYHDSSVTRINPASMAVVASTFAGNLPSAIAFGNGSVWVANAGDSSVTRIDPKTNGRDTTISVGRRPSGIAVGSGALWVADTSDDAVSRIYPPSNSSTTIAAGRGPVGIAYGAGAVWVANSEDGTVSRIDPVTGTVVARIPVGNRPWGIAFGGGAVWVTVQAQERVT